VAVEGQELSNVLRRAVRVDVLARIWQAKGNISSWPSLGQIINSRDNQLEIIRAVPSRQAADCR
jgi:hypothetical protein